MFHHVIIVVFHHVILFYHFMIIDDVLSKYLVLPFNLFYPVCVALLYRKQVIYQHNAERLVTWACPTRVREISSKLSIIRNSIWASPLRWMTGWLKPSPSAAWVEYITLSTTINKHPRYVEGHDPIIHSIAALVVIPGLGPNRMCFITLNLTELCV